MNILINLTQFLELYLQFEAVLGIKILLTIFTIEHFVIIIRLFSTFLPIFLSKDKDP